MQKFFIIIAIIFSFTTSLFAQKQNKQMPVDRQYLVENLASLNKFPNQKLALGKKHTGTGYIVKCPLSIEENGFINFPTGKSQKIDVFILLGKTLTKVSARVANENLHDPDNWKRWFITTQKVEKIFDELTRSYSIVYMEEMECSVTYEVIEGGDGEPMLVYSVYF